MANHHQMPATVRNFSLAFEQMCSMVAISQTRSTHDTLRELVLQCFVVLPNERFRDDRQIADAIDTLFGLRIPEHEAQFAVDSLVNDGHLTLANGIIYLPLELHAQMQKRIDDAVGLEEAVRKDWLTEVSDIYPLLAPDILWGLLRKYLATAFRRHGVQAILLLDPSGDNDPEYTESLSGLLDHVSKDVLPEVRPDAKRAISGFLAKAGQNPNRAAYITQLADGAFNYYSLTIAPDVAEKFRQQLLPLTLFLDTNFLFGILDLTVNPQVDVSNALLAAIKKHNLPFKLRYHKFTERELTSSVAHHEDVLRSHRWPRQLSRAAAESRNLSGVEQKYHERHAETGIDVEDFFRPYRHVDILLKDKAIDVFAPQSERLTERADLLHEYQDYLRARGRDKPYVLIDHDTTVLDAVRQLQATAKSSLHAGALLITCDYALYGFDVESSRKLGKPPSTVMPNVFWQVLRPFIPTDTDFDLTFAQTFAIPEFRTIGSGAALACSRMLHILAGYQDFPEETAARMLSNDLLVDRLRKSKDDAEFQQIVESAIAQENAALVEENAALAVQLEQERAQKQAEFEKAQQANVLEELELRQRLDDNQGKYQVLLGDIERERTARQQAETRAAEETAARERAEAVGRNLAIATALLLSALVVVGFEVLIWKLPWSWLIDHPNSYGLQASFDLTIIFGALGIFVPKWRKWCWGGVVVTLGSVFLQLLGGPRK